MNISTLNIDLFVKHRPTNELTKPSFVAVISFLLLIHSSALFAIEESALNTTANGDTGISAQLLIWFLVGLLIASILVVSVLTRWSHKQDNINNMMSFCIKYLIETSNEADKCAAASALGHVKDPRALLILADLINDENAGDKLHKTAIEALQTLSKIYRKYENAINQLLAAVEEKDHKKSIQILIQNFEKQERKFVQSAYVIGREYMRLKQYPEAREWLQKAKIRNRQTVVYVHQISERIDICNEKLFAEGDTLFQSGDYYNALERYALASHDLRHEDKLRFVCHLRLACVYSKLMHYKDAYQETLHALRDHHATDMSLQLNSQLKKLQEKRTTAPLSDEKRKSILTEIDSFVADVMAGLTAKQSADKNT